MTLDKVTKKVYVLELSEEEAQFLVSVTGSLTGSGRGREFTDNLYDLLSSYGVREHAQECDTGKWGEEDECDECGCE